MNIKKYYVRQFFHELMPIYPIYSLLFQSKGLSVQHISLLLAIWSLPLVLLEIPTGVLSDRWSRRNMITLGSFFKASCYFLWIFSEGFLLFAIGFVLWGIGEAFISGAEEALLYDSLKSQDKEDIFDQVLGKGRFLAGTGNVIASIAGGFIGMYGGYQYALYLSVITALLSTAIGFGYKEVNYYKQRVIEKIHKDSGDTFRNALLFLTSNMKILIFSLLAIFVIGFAGVLDEYDPLIAKSYGLSIAGVGIWASIRFLLMALGGYLSHGLQKAVKKLFRIKNRFYTLILLCLSAVACLIWAGVIRNLFIMGIYGLYYLIMSASEVQVEDYIQKKIEDEGRATVHSILSLSYNLYGLAACGAIAILFHWIDIQEFLLWVAGYITLLVFGLAILYYCKSCKKG
ncbi:MFS transporter [Mobilitalea sibirica]|uniref:MFS transporter n=1 Tax=Mobilitalea sibirica TaxID=1462919 RepID=A0A8J7HE55_9FIRM|nr:MFS transporter [Mobilitalea sibirica]MBH1941614.1 MFS transporter [Mobilitalea sibirica]